MGGSDDKESTCNAGDPSLILGGEDPLEKEMASRSSILAWRIPWTEEPGGLQSTGSHRIGIGLVTNTQHTNKSRRQFVLFQFAKPFFIYPHHSNILHQAKSGCSYQYRGGIRYEMNSVLIPISGISERK